MALPTSNWQMKTESIGETKDVSKSYNGQPSNEP
jgi:hypothetical protein